MNSMQLRDKLKNVSKEKNIDFNILLRLYMYDRFIERLSLSNNKDKFILKGGFYLSSFFGIENRSTMDIDTAVVKTNFTEDNIEKMIKEIIDINLNDNAIITFSNISPIRNEDEYGGYRVDLTVTIENIKEKFHVDVATGDPITPGAITYKYKSLLENKEIKVWAYNIETVLAEKLETILSRSILNGRMRDYYDVYLIYIKEWDNINKDNLRKAIKNTFVKRQFDGKIYEILDLLRNDENIKRSWNNYLIKTEYANNIDFNLILGYIEEIINVVELVEV